MYSVYRADKKTLDNVYTQLKPPKPYACVWKKKVIGGI